MICIALMAQDTEEALKKMTVASPNCDLMEVRLDVMKSFDLEKIISSAQKPLLITYRSKKEGGKGDIPDNARVDYLLEAVRLGADYIDVEYAMPLEHRDRLFEGRGKSRLVLSKHFMDGTPSEETLSHLLKKMTATGAHVVKIVTQARTTLDNLSVLRLIPESEALGVKAVAFCMGPLGRISRVACPLLGGAFTFAAFREGQESAPGQITAKEMKYMLERLGS
ncbi:3-dehydroquinate dehydratase, type I [delta proteobacterium NaphS2]|nr:3-dehydroquinate dehydratase, type I [delta proteobacterium NaphS2]